MTETSDVTQDTTFDVGPEPGPAVESAASPASASAATASAAATASLAALTLAACGGAAEPGAWPAHARDPAQARDDPLVPMTLRP